MSSTIKCLGCGAEMSLDGITTQAIERMLVAERERDHAQAQLKTELAGLQAELARVYKTIAKQHLFSEGYEDD